MAAGAQLALAAVPKPFGMQLPPRRCSNCAILDFDRTGLPLAVDVGVTGFPSAHPSCQRGAALLTFAAHS